MKSTTHNTTQHNTFEREEPDCTCAKMSSSTNEIYIPTEEEKKYQEEEDSCRQDATDSMMAGYCNGGPLVPEAAEHLSTGAPSSRSQRKKRMLALPAANEEQDNRVEQKIPSLSGQAAAPSQTCAAATKATNGLDSSPTAFLVHPRTMQNWYQLRNDVVTTYKPLLRRAESTCMTEKSFRMYKVLRSVPFLQEIVGGEEFTRIQNTIKKKEDSFSAMSVIFAISDLQNVHLELVNVHTNLLQLAMLSQAEGSTQSKTSTSKASSLDQMDLEAARNVENMGLKTGDLGRPKTLETLARLGDRMLTARKDLGVYEKAVESFNAKFQKMVQQIVKSWANPNESTVPSMDKKRRDTSMDKKRRDQDIKQMEAWLSQDGTPTVSATTFASCLPAPRSDEKLEAQPFLAALLRSLGNCLDDVYDNERITWPKIAGTPPKTAALRDRQRRFLEKDERNRIADGSIAVHGRFVYLLRDDAVEIPVEMKPTLRMSQPNPRDLAEEAADQIYAHLARHVGVCFNFAGAGVDGKATGVVLLTSCVKIIQLQLINMGTAKVRLVGFETPLLPLMTRDNYDEWTAGVEEKQKIAGLKNILYPSSSEQENESSGAVDKEIPAGIIALASLFISRREELFGPDKDKWKSEKLDTLIGHGSFSTVYTHKHKTNAVIKLSRYGETSELEREAAVLKELQQEKCDLIVRASKDDTTTTVSVHLGGVEVHIPAIILEPRGFPIWTHPDLIYSETKKATVLRFGKDLQKALEFVHRRKYLHNDISPNNIMFTREKKVFLIDFGLASKVGDKLKGFKGSPLFAHAQVFRKYPSRTWEAKIEHDFAGLSFSMAAIMSGRRRPWLAFQPCNVNEGKKSLFQGWVSERHKEATKWLTDAGFTREWLDWCDEQHVIAS